MRRGFVQKVLFIVAIQLLVTTGICLAFFFVEPIKVRFRPQQSRPSPPPHLVPPSLRFLRVFELKHAAPCVRLIARAGRACHSRYEL